MGSFLAPLVTFLFAFPINAFYFGKIESVMTNLVKTFQIFFIYFTKNTYLCAALTNHKKIIVYFKGCARHLLGKILWDIIHKMNCLQLLQH